MGSQFVEIAHEFLIDPLQSEILRNVDAGERMFRFAQRNVADALRANLLGKKTKIERRAQTLPRNAVAALIDNADRCHWRDEDLELLLHAAVQNGLSRKHFVQLFELCETGKANGHSQSERGGPL